jgi:hypothetical protein
MVRHAIVAGIHLEMFLLYDFFMQSNRVVIAFHFFLHYLYLSFFIYGWFVCTLHYFILISMGIFSVSPDEAKLCCCVCVFGSVSGDCQRHWLRWFVVCSNESEPCLVIQPHSFSLVPLYHRSKHTYRS